MLSKIDNYMFLTMILHQTLHVYTRYTSIYTKSFHETTYMYIHDSLFVKDTKVVYVSATPLIIEKWLHALSTVVPVDSWVELLQVNLRNYFCCYN